MSNMTDAWYQLKNVDRLDTPALVFYPDRIKQNISILKSFVTDVGQLRPHVKTHKCAEVTRLMLGAGITKYKCATIAEAEMLGMCHAPDVLLAYQPVLTKMHRLSQLIFNYPQTTFSCLADNVASAAMMSAEAEKLGYRLNVFVDINVGMNRTGILPDRAFELYQFCSALPGINVKGLHAYDGHIYKSDLQKRTQECIEAFAPVQQLIAQIEEAGFSKPVIVAGGTPTFPVFAKMPDVECSPGTFALWDKGYGALFPDLPFLPAALVITRVISKPNDYTLCLDMGHKAIAAENELNKRVEILNLPNLYFTGHSEEHLVVKTAGPNSVNIGDVFYGLPVHICPTCALYDRAGVVSNGLLTTEWKIIARDRMINY
ncbi:D-TA family PLP-dependent enzyme [Mucilaginibacter sp. CSA2-8R]|uniref:D-TA family PLP-dependent enzyme n=1 Tax=Mucilaginibacter sp. CSA2-8R TaxID=3141542 RepID=UPI00315CEA8E